MNIICTLLAFILKICGCYDKRHNIREEGGQLLLLVDQVYLGGRGAGVGGGGYILDFKIQKVN